MEKDTESIGGIMLLHALISCCFASNLKFIEGSFIRGDLAYLASVRFPVASQAPVIVSSAKVELDCVKAHCSSEVDPPP